MKKFAVIPMMLIVVGCSSAPNMQYLPKSESLIVTNAQSIPYHFDNVKVSVDPKAAANDAFFFGHNNDKYTETFKTTFETALHNSLIASNLFKADAKKNVELTAKVLRFSQLSVGLNFPTEMVVRYQLVDKTTKKVLFTTEVTSNAEVAVTSAYLGTKRAIKARNEAVQLNISTLLLRLNNANIR